MQFYYISYLQKLDLGISTLLFCIFIQFLRPIILGQEVITKNIIAFTLIFFAWYGCTLMTSNAFSYQYQYNKLVSNI